MRRAVAPALAAVAAAGALTGSAGGAAAQPALTAGSVERGFVSLVLRSEPGVPVTIDELGAGRIATVTPAGPETVLPRAAEWSCERRTRRFSATTPDGATALAEVRTPSCARRLRLSAPGRVRAGRPVEARLVDRWRLGGIAARVCVEPPGGPARCSRARLRPGRPAQPVRFRALRAGGWRLVASTPWGRADAPVHALPRGGRLRLLATGDSMIQVLDGFMRERLGRRAVRVRSDAHISTGISKPSLLDWQAQARRQAAARPDVVVMFLGANDGFPMGEAACCGQAWIAEYARRARRMMAAYGRGGRARVYWLLLPAPRGGFFRRSFPAVNAAIRRAAAGARRDARVIDLVQVFTPGGRYRERMTIGGRTVRVRQPDGVHLSAAGASHAASVVIRTLRRERILR